MSRIKGQKHHVVYINWHSHRLNEVMQVQGREWRWLAQRVGCHFTLMSRIKTGKRPVPDWIALEAARVLGIPFDWLFSDPQAHPRAPFIGPREVTRGKYDNAFWMFVEKRGDDDCWPWKGAKNRQTGYGIAGKRGSRRYAHRMAYELTHGPAPDGLFILHHCDYPPCCNPAHLYAGTAIDNARDRSRRGRNNSKALTVDDVCHIRRLLTTEAVETVAARFAVSAATIYNIRSGRTWKHVTDEETLVAA